jgi:hypothetical protein
MINQLETTTTGTHTGTHTELIGTLTRAELKFLQVGCSTDKTRMVLNSAVVRYSIKCNSWIVATTDTHRMHVVRTGTNQCLDNVKSDIEKVVDINSIIRQMVAFKSDKLDILARVSTSGEFIGLEFIAQNVPDIQNPIIGLGQFPNVERIFLDSLDSIHVGLKGAFNGAYISDACLNLVNKKEENTQRVTFWQEKPLSIAYALDSTCWVSGASVSLGRKFAIVMPMQII